MIDFLMISTRSTKRGVIEIYPKFIIKKSRDLMIRGGDFYAIWLEDRGLWSTDEQDALQLIDRELDKYAESNRQKFDSDVRVLHMWDSESGMIDAWHRYVQKHMRDSFHMLDEKLIFSNTEVNKNDFASKRLPYPLEHGDISAYDKIIGTLYSEEERRKIEWAIGSIVTGESKHIQKFMVLYGSAGTGKSTILNIVQMLFEGYYSVFDAKALGSNSNTFALEAFKSNPLVAIQHDGDLSHIEDNTRLNSLVSHELMTVNEKFKSTYSNRFKCFLFMGTNKPVRITDAKSGLIRRLIDVSPSGEKLSLAEYNLAMKKIEFELGAIASHCRDVYLENRDLYDNYIPTAMLGASNDFYNFIIDNYYIFEKDDSTTLKASWAMYKEYCEYAKVAYPMSQRAFKEELKNYFYEFEERHNMDDNTRVRNYYSGFRKDKFEPSEDVSKVVKIEPKLIDFNSTVSLFDKECCDCLAQYGNDAEIPRKKWADVITTLSDIDTTKLHYVKVPENHIVIDFDIPDENGKKSLEKNLIEASKFPPTYAELSKSGCGIHLHYIYSGDVSKLSRVYGDHIEVKIFNGGSSLRRKLSKCNDLPINVISSGLPLKGENKMINFDGIKSEASLRTQILRNLNKEIHAATKPSIDFIYKILEDAYKSNLHYDVSDMRNAIIAFAANSTNQSDYCLKLVNKMKFKSEEQSENFEPDCSFKVYTNVFDGIDDESIKKLNKNNNLLSVANCNRMIFYDIEVFPNLFVVCWKLDDEEKPVVRIINPKPADIEALMRFKLVGFNCRKYDNHIMYAALMGYTNEQLYKLSQKIINGAPDCFFGEAYNMSYTDILDFASAGNKKSLKKLEIEMGIHHQELGLPWDKPVPEKLWNKVAEYCDNDVIATEAAFHYLNADWTARCILADLADMTRNDTTNSLTTRIIFGKNRKPQGEFCYRNLAEPVLEMDPEVFDFLKTACPKMMEEKHSAATIPFNTEDSFLPYFWGYEYKFGKSTYRGEEVGEGGYVYAEPGIYTDVALLDIASMHPHSLIAECLFGVRFTTAFRDIVEGRVSTKHEDWDTVNNMLDGKFRPYIQKVINGEMTSDDLANALKTAINSVYGLTSAKFENPFKDPRNVDNIVAKRGALFMVDLKHEVQERGFTVVHIKTDSIKIANATPEIIQFVYDFGLRYGYTFEHEATYDRICLVNDAVYIAKYATVERCCELYGEEYVNREKDNIKKNKKKPGEWTATGTQFQVPYVFKTLFSKEDICFDDMCETKSVQTALYLDMNESLQDVSKLEDEKDKLWKQITDTNKLNEPMTEECARIEELSEMIAKGHDYHFVGRVGQFCPMKAGSGGGLLLRETVNKSTGERGYASATGAKGYRWMESEMVKSLGKEADIDRTYYDKLVSDAIDSINKYDDFEWFVSDELSEQLRRPF